jgi:hypothetical protein
MAGTTPEVDVGSRDCIESGVEGNLKIAYLTVYFIAHVSIQPY